MSATTVAPGETRPRALPLDAAAILDDLKRLPQWVGWRYEQTEAGKWTKEPYQARRPDAKAATTRPVEWSSFSVAEAAYRAGHFDGVGFVFSPDDPFMGVDLDDCRDAESGVVQAWALDIVRRMGGYVELSPSGRGLHIIVRGTLPQGGRKRGSVEMYDRVRYFAVTGHLFELPS